MNRVGEILISTPASVQVGRVHHEISWYGYMAIATAVAENSKVSVTAAARNQGLAR